MKEINLNGFCIVSEVTNIDNYKEEHQLSESIQDMVLETSEIQIPFNEEHVRVFKMNDSYIIEYSDLLRLKESFENRNNETYHMNTMINNIKAHYSLSEDVELMVSIREMNDISSIKTNLSKVSSDDVVKKNNEILRATARNLEELKISGVKLIKILFT